MIDIIIANYLEKNKRLVVPDFGAFIRKDGGEIVFVEFLKKDDQILTSILGRDYGFSEAEAREAIGEYMLTVKRSVGSSGRYIIEGVGQIYTDANGLYSLKYDPLAKREAAPMPEPVAEAPISAPRQQEKPVPRMEVISLAVEREEPKMAEETPSVSDDIIMEPKYGAKEEIPVVTPAPEPPAKDDTIEFRYREVVVESTPEPEKKPFTLNDLYSVPANEPAAKSEPAYTPRTSPVQPASAPRPFASPAGEATQPARPARPKPLNYRGGKKSKTDIVMIIAVVAALIAIVTLIYGITVKRDPQIKPTRPQTEQTEQTETMPDVEQTLQDGEFEQ